MKIIYKHHMGVRLSWLEMPIHELFSTGDFDPQGGSD